MYPDLLPASPYLDEVPISTFHQLQELSYDEFYFFDVLCDTLGSNSDYGGISSSPQSFSHNELSDLISDLSLLKEASELLASRLNEKNILAHGKKNYNLPCEGKIFVTLFLFLYSVKY